MDPMTACPCCPDAAVSGRWALVSPFIAAYVLDGPVETCRLLECARCGLRFFDRRFDAAETGRLYAGYRGEAYFRARHRAEFWYTRRLNDGMGSVPELVEGRRRRLAAFLGPHLDPRQAQERRILDFGGDSGQMIPEAFGTTRFVFEVSDVPPVAGVTRISDEGGLEPGGYDLVLLCHVLEHSGDPAGLIRHLKGLLRPGTGLLYIEVPLERFGTRFAGRGALYRRWLRWLARHPRLLTWLDFYSTGARVALNLIPPFGFAKLHEHLNFFTLDALRELAAREGLDWVASATQPLAPGVDDAPVLACVVRSGAAGLRG
jgi:SAM-dependent methyltransferase